MKARKSLIAVGSMIMVGAFFYLLVSGSGQFFPPLSALRPPDALAASDMPGMPGMEADHRPRQSPQPHRLNQPHKRSPPLKYPPKNSR